MAFGTKCNWNYWSLGQNVFGTFGVWDKSLDFGIFLGQKALRQNVSRTIHLVTESYWDKSLRNTVPCIKPGMVTLIYLGGNYYPRQQRFLGQNVVGTYCYWNKM